MTPPQDQRAARPCAPTYDAVLFDMDGTLVDSTASVVRCWLRLAEENGITVQDLQGAAGHGRPARDIVADLFAPDGPGVRPAAHHRPRGGRRGRGRGPPRARRTP